MKEKIIDIKLLKFLLVGVVNTLVGAGIMFLLYNAFHCDYWFSSACNYIAGGICSFFLNKYFTFKNTKKSFKQVFLFILNLLICYFISYIAAKWIIYHIFVNKSETFKDNFSMLVGMCLYTVLNYISQRFIVFKES